jgi:hypothetical protein
MTHAQLLEENSKMRALGTQLEQQVKAMTEENHRLAAQQAQMQAQLHAQQAAASSSSRPPVPVVVPVAQERAPKSQLKAPQLKAFLGVMGFEVDTWLRSVKKQFDWHGASVFPDDASRIKYAAIYLEGAALEWWDSEDQASIRTWDEFVERLHDRYRPKQAAEVARQSLAALKQTGSVSQLCNKMLQLLAHVPTMHEDDKIFTFKQALDKNLAAKVAEKEPKSLHDAMYIAVQAELYVGRASGSRGTGGFFNFGNRGGFSGRSSTSAGGSTPMEVNHIGSPTDSEEFMANLYLDQPVKATSTPEQSGTPEREQQLLSMVQQLQAQQYALAAAFQKRSGGGDRKGAASGSSGKVPGVSKEEFERCRKEGLCLKCKEAGHLARDCTKPVRHLKW